MLLQYSAGEIALTSYWACAYQEPKNHVTCVTSAYSFSLSVPFRLADVLKFVHSVERIETLGINDKALFFMPISVEGRPRIQEGCVFLHLPAVIVDKTVNSSDLTSVDVLNSSLDANSASNMARA